MQDDLMKCICCNQEQEVLISTVMKKDSIFLRSRGICQNCLKNKDVNLVCLEFEVRKTEESIRESEEKLEYLKEHLARLNKNEMLR